MTARLEPHRQAWMTDDQWECAQMIRDLFRGFHHVSGKIKPNRGGVEVSVYDERWAATFDTDGLTRAVVMAHDRMIRFQIASSSPKRLKLYLDKRTREGDLYSRHPTIEEAIASARGKC